MGEQLKIGENLKNIRKSMGLSLDAVSSMTGVSKTMLSQIERSESVPTLATVSKIANGLKIRFDNLLTSPQSLYCDIKYIENISPVVDNDGKILFYCFFHLHLQQALKFSIVFSSLDAIMCRRLTRTGGQST